LGIFLRVIDPAKSNLIRSKGKIAVFVNPAVINPRMKSLKNFSFVLVGFSDIDLKKFKINFEKKI